jgi:GR25 family glycosyltransferase involved in LPS biosynthesis
MGADEKPWLGKDVALEWDTTKNARWDKHVEGGMTRTLTPGEIGCALSHVKLWYELAANMPPPPDFADGTDVGTKPDADTAMLILEDDAAFLHPERGGNFRDCNPGKLLSRVRFRIAFRKAWELLPADWEMFYLGFSDRGERKGLIHSETGLDNITVALFSPEYGFHTHAYAIKQSAAKALLDNLPVVGPIDVWLADNNWFGLRTYVGIVTNDGYKNMGANLICQNRVGESSIPQSGRVGVL